MVRASSSHSQGRDNGSSVLSQWRDSLITREDPFHLHKTLGVLCLVSYCWRFYFAIRGREDMGFKIFSEWTLPTLVLHLALNLSSFEFKIPPKRIDSGYRIWPEYRFHSLVFLCRSLALMAIQWYDDTYDLVPNHFWNLVVVMATIAAADLGSRYYYEKSSGFARNLQVHPAIKFFFSFLQIQATTGCLFIASDRYSMHFIFCMIIQVNAFLMTLRRKNLAGHYTLISIYGAMLLGGWIIGDQQITRLGLKSKYILIIIGQTATFLRLSPRVLPAPLSIVQSKYFIWPFAYSILRLFAEKQVVDERHLFYSALACNAAVVLMGIYKVNYDYPSTKDKVDTKLS